MNEALPRILAVSTGPVALIKGAAVVAGSRESREPTFRQLNDETQTHADKDTMMMMRLRQARCGPSADIRRGPRGTAGGWWRRR